MNPLPKIAGQIDICEEHLLNTNISQKLILTTASRSNIVSKIEKLLATTADALPCTVFAPLHFNQSSTKHQKKPNRSLLCQKPFLSYPSTILITMSSTTTKTPRQLAEINSLSARLSTTKSNRSTQIEAINQLKMRRVNEYTILLKLRDEPDQKDREAQFADFVLHLEGMDDIESQRARALREWTELGGQLQRACEELSVLEQEISELERILSCWNFMEMLGA